MDPRVQIIINLIQEDVRNSPSVEELAQFVRLSPDRLNHLFKNETDASLAQYLKSLRMTSAKNLLETTFLNVKETMARVGVNDLSHFVRDFKKEFGMTPSEYRSQHFRQVAMTLQFRNSKRSQRTPKLANK